MKLKDENEKMIEEIQKCRDESEKIGEEIQKSRDESEKIGEEIQKGRDESEKMKEEIQKGRDESEKMKEEIQKGRDENENLKEEMHDLKMIMSNLILRQSILDINHALGKSVFGKSAKPGYVTLGDIRRNIEEQRDPAVQSSLETELNDTMNRVGWTPSFEECKVNVKLKYNLNSVAHPKVNSHNLH